MHARSFIARPAPGGYNGVVVHDLDRPIHKVPLLLDGAPPSLVTELTGGTEFSSMPLDNFLITTDGSPPTRAFDSATTPPTGPSECRHR
ncbi:hypothetical protein [Streptomyces sp. NPDC093018]|uniref:hypothetical protein n=1 Tax=Streptomyces sp. NPDC093018 TaxID=3155067 RepID=UPI003425E78B